MKLIDLANDVRNIIRGGSTDASDSISLRQVAYWIVTIYPELIGRYMGAEQRDSSAESVFIQRYPCIPVKYPAEAPCGCEARGLTVGRVDLPSLLVKQMEAVVEYASRSEAYKSAIRATADTAYGLATGKGQHSAIARPRDVFYVVSQVGTKEGLTASPRLYFVPAVGSERPDNLKLHIGQANPFLNLANNEIFTPAGLGTLIDREVPFPMWVVRTIRMEALKVEASTILKTLELHDITNDAASKPVRQDA